MIGLVLEGGGVKGAYQAGVLKAVCERGAKFDAVAGTSIGAVNGALYAQGGYEYVCDMWRSRELAAILENDAEALDRLRSHEVDGETIRYIGKRVVKLRQVLSESAKRAEEFLRSYLDEERLRSAQCDYGLVTYDLTDRRGVELMLEDIPKGELVDHVVASATYPTFPPKIIGDKRYIDGGVYDNMPIGLLASRGYTKMLVIRTNVASKRPKRAVGYNNANLYFIVPEDDLGRAMDFTSEKMSELFELGYDSGKRALECGLAEFLQL